MSHSTMPAESAGRLTAGATFGGFHVQPVHALSQVAARLMIVLQVVRERRQLAALDPRLLKDIGLSESTAFSETQRSMFDLPVRRKF